ncbi:MAG: hypothetical protein KDA75_18000, partial [Planctomycetaceae bacterium]|nr:hypothetical protein [Planctomycetaceae bacterium]
MSTIRTYRASSVREALALVRAELGDNALILGQREIRKRPFPWRKVKVVAELTVADTAIMLPSERVEANSGTNSRFKSSRIADLSRGLCRADADRAGPAFSDRDSVPVPGPSTETAPPKRDDPFHLYTQLIEQDVDESVARHLVGEVQAHSSVTGEGGFTGRCRDLIEQSLSCSGPIRVTPGRRR